jgi:hypothetical protein
MPTDAKLKAFIEALLRTQAPAIRKAFIASMNDARSAIMLKDVIAALARGDLASAQRALELSRTFFAPLDMAIQGAYFEGGRDYLNLVMAGRPRGTADFQVRFDPGNPVAAGWLKQHSSDLITDIIEEQRTSVRSALDLGMQSGKGPGNVALDIIGRIDKTSKKRVGGIITITEQQAQFVRNAERQLRSGDPKQLRAYMRRARRDRRFDPIVRTALKQGRAVAASDITKMAAHYSERLLAYRGEVVARTEALTALSHSQTEGMRQLIEASGLRADQITKEWRATGLRTRDTHIAMHGQKQLLDEPFISPRGARMMFPRDASLGAPPEEIIQCRCRLNHRVTW